MGVLETLDNISNALKSPAKLDTIGGMAVEMIRSKIHQGKGFDPLAPATVAYRGAGRPLQDLSGLRDSITYQEINGQTVSVGTNKVYAAIQNNGGVIRAKKEWLWIPGPGLRQIQRSVGFEIRDVLNHYKSQGYSIYRRGRSIGYNDKKIKVLNAKGKLEPKYHILYYLKKSVEIPKREFFYLTDKEMNLIAQEAGVSLEQL